MVSIYEFYVKLSHALSTKDNIIHWESLRLAIPATATFIEYKDFEVFYEM